ncbi:hypothetical protein SAMN04488096_104227 [Mesonia phycicola]|uniref:Uncharacterized protein n=1 Tax=Mesonia phycicola TaxID=579105 RepID=A0A1M6DXF8_9FLAO|nr:hypothetical protein [Mesonia phycicola]SHI77926.1 hypothetical protein SAMN04488096_104227 [Mesonia phycicola]
MSRNEKIKHINKDVLTNIDKVLNSIYDHGNSSKIRVINKTRTIAVALNLIHEKEPLTFYLSENGILALQEGGIKNYLEKLGAEKDLDLIIKGLTKKSLKNQFLYNIMYVGVGGVIGILTILVTPDTTEKYIQELNKIVKQKNKNNSNLKTEIKQIRLEINSLKKQVNSLKNVSE